MTTVRRITNRLDEWRLGKVGVALFYAYLIAILIVAVLLMRGYTALKHTQHDILAQQARSCAAIEAAAGYWRSELSISYAAIADPQTMPGARERQGRRITALTHLLAQGAKIDCQGGD